MNPISRALIAVALTLSFGVGQALAANDRPSGRDYTVGKPTQKVTPREMKETVRSDGSRSVVTGQQRDSSGRITGPHTHSVVRDGKVEYSRTARGHEVAPRAPQVPIGGTLPRGSAGGPGGGGGLPPLKR